MPEIITIPDIQGNFYGGRPYTVNLSLGYAENPSNLTINVVNEIGQYSKPNLNYNTIVNIKIGDVNFNGYLISYDILNSVPQKELELRYIDCSRLLDVWYVGLHKRHGINQQAKWNYNNVINTVNQKSRDGKNTTPYLAILGVELHPCDVNRDGNINGIDAALQVDWCDPCPTCPPNKYEFRCGGENDLMIFDVGYTFIDLLEYFGIPVPEKIREYPKFYRDYTGKLRDVLQSWCQDFGYTFYWDYSATSIAGGIKLVDRTVPISVNYNPNLCDVNDISEGETIENSFVTNTISYYQREGMVKEYNCEGMDFYTLKCLKYRDLINPSNYSNVDVLIRWKELAISLSYYSDSLRDCLYWFNYYNITKASDAKAYEWTEQDDKSASYKLNTSKIFKELGGMKIRRVIDVNDPFFKNCEELLGDDLKIYKDRSEKDMKRDSSNPSYYFFIGEVDEELLKNAYLDDAKIANDYFGKFWLRRTNAVTCASAGSNPRYSNVNIECPDGNGRWYSQTLDSVYLDFANFGHQEGSEIDEFLIKTSQDQNKTYDQTVDIGYGNTQTYSPNASFILVERDAKWYPNSNQMSDYAGTLDYYRKLVFNRVDASSAGRPEVIRLINPQWAENPNIYLFVVQEINGSELPITISEIPNFLEPDQLKKITADANDTAVCKSYSDVNGGGQKTIGTYGLTSNETAWVTFDGFQFMVPVEATELITRQFVSPFNTIPENNDEGSYKVMARQSFNVPVCIPKIQNSLINWTSPNSVGSCEVNFSDISDDDIAVFALGTCIPSNEQLQRIHTEKNVMLSISNDKPEKTKKFQIVGTPKNSPLISQGLDSIDIRVSDEGVFTSYSLSDKIRRPISTELLLLKKQLENIKTYNRIPTVNNYPTRKSGNS